MQAPECNATAFFAFGVDFAFFFPVALAAILKDDG
jgi:hypothetical protein